MSSDDINLGYEYDGHHEELLDLIQALRIWTKFALITELLRRTDSDPVFTEDASAFLVGGLR
ncbi:hypothetical protein [Micromonospora sp. CA-246542]|uniref:hypothetical protein n=1 Tax=Micromonospora sp. CA-246542 TaxID=3239959 RepID=UPI003D8E53FB